MKKLLLCSICVTSLNSFAAPMPVPTQPLSIVPLSQINMPAQFKKEFDKNLLSESKNGFIESDESKYVKFFLNLPKTAPKEMLDFRGADVTDTHLKKTSKEINLAFKINWNEPKNIIGYAAINGYNNGWTGLRTFFTDPTLGVCSYSYLDFVSSQGAAILPKEYTEYLVNKKPSNKTITGSYAGGFIYTVNWYTAKSANTLECANMKFDKSLLDNVILMANKIDK